MVRPFISGYIELIRVAHAFDAPCETVGKMALEIGAYCIIDDGRQTRVEVPKESIGKMLEIIASFRRDRTNEISNAKNSAHKATLVDAYNDGFSYICTMPESLGGLWVKEQDAYEAMVQAGYTLQSKVFADGVTAFSFLNEEDKMHSTLQNASPSTPTGPFTEKLHTPSHEEAVRLAGGWSALDSENEILRVGLMLIQGKPHSTIHSEMGCAGKGNPKDYVQYRKRKFLDYAKGKGYDFKEHVTKA